MDFPFPLVKISGTPHERGAQYGEAVGERIKKCLANYKALFLGASGLEWGDAIATSHRFEKYISDYMPDAILEMRGIAEGAGVPYDEILTLNCRSELLFALPDGCTSIAVPEKASADGKPYIAQNWDWLISARDVTTIVEIRQDPLPSVLMVCEAGMVGGKGVNSAGVGVGLNALGVGKGQLGVPLHIMYRGINNARTISDAVDVVAKNTRAGSGNFAIGSADDLFFHLEFSPDKFFPLIAVDDPLVHANHYLSPILQADDTLKAATTCTFARYAAALKAAKRLNGKLDKKGIWELLCDHRGYPDSVCSHEDMNDSEWIRYCTVYGIVIDLAERKIEVSAGNPCESARQEFVLSR